MDHIIQIKPSGYLLFVADGETVLDAALRQGFEFPYSCGSGTCGTCMGKVIDGNFTYGDIEPYALDDAAEGENFALFCSVKPTSDMVIELEDVYGPEYLPVRKTDYQIVDYKILKDDIYQVFLLPKKKKIQYHAGQYLKITCDDGIPIPFSIANAPAADGKLELQIKAMVDNPYTTEIIQKINKKSSLQIRGPYGHVMFRSEPDLPTIFVAGGTGIVPLKAIIEEALAKKDGRVMHLYWGGNTATDLYLSEQMQQLAATHDNFEFTPIITHADDYWEGATGFVHEIVAQEHNDLSSHQIYASGPTEMVYAAFDAFTAQGLKSQLMFSDTFEYAPRET